jgi:hypothetical protein
MNNIFWYDIWLEKLTTMIQVDLEKTIQLKECWNIINLLKVQDFYEICIKNSDIYNKLDKKSLQIVRLKIHSSKIIFSEEQKKLLKKLDLI